MGPARSGNERPQSSANTQNIAATFERDMQRVASKAPAAFAPQVKDTQKRLGLLYDHLNSGDLISPGTIDKLAQLSQALEAKNYDAAAAVQADIAQSAPNELGAWMVSARNDHP